MHPFRELAAAIVTVIATIGSVFLVAIGWLWAFVGDAPVPQPIRQILDATTAWLPFWIVVSVFAGIILCYRTYKSFKALDEISEIRRETGAASQRVAQLAEQSEDNLTEARRLSDAFWEDNRSGAKILWEVLYLSVCAKPELERRIAATERELEVWQKGGGVVEVIEYERGQDEFDYLLGKLLGIGPGTTVFAEVPDERPWKPGDYPTRAMFIRKLQAQVNRYEHFLGAIEGKVNEASNFPYRALHNPQIDAR